MKRTPEEWKEWGQNPTTKEFVEELKLLKEGAKDNAVDAVACNNLHRAGLETGAILQIVTVLEFIESKTVEEETEEEEETDAD